MQKNNYKKRNAKSLEALSVFKGAVNSFAQSLGMQAVEVKMENYFMPGDRVIRTEGRKGDTGIIIYCELDTPRAQVKWDHSGFKTKIKLTSIKKITDAKN